jgi:hypothetical protein
MRHQSKELKNRINRTGLHCVWTRSDRTPGAPLTARWVCEPQTPNQNRDGGSDRKRKGEDT